MTIDNLLYFINQKDKDIKLAKQRGKNTVYHSGEEKRKGKMTRKEKGRERLTELTRKDTTKGREKERENRETTMNREEEKQPDGGRGGRGGRDEWIDGGRPNE